MSANADKPEPARRLAAIAAMLLVLIVIVWSAVVIAGDVGRVAIQIPFAILGFVAVWYALTRTGGKRLVATIVAVAAFAGAVIAGFLDEGLEGVSALVRVGMLVGAVGLTRYATHRDITSLKLSETPGTPAHPARKGVLIMNLKSGGGKAEKFNLVDECRKRGIEPVVLEPGNDLLDLANDAVDRGADVLGMAGGDGSQALVATVAAERDVPMVVVPAGTRNHLALDLGLDRDDVVGTLDAFQNAVERPMDLADVNGKVFVNNVSLGVYASIVRSPEYRDAKVETTLATLPQILGPNTPEFDLHFTDDDGKRHDGPVLVQVSNNPYGKGSTGSRPRMDTRRLGVIALELKGDRAAASFVTALAAGNAERFEGFTAFSPETFVVDSGSAVDVGLDGESLSMDPPLRFSIRDKQLRVRLPQHAIGYSPAARSLTPSEAAQGVWRVALGKPVLPPSGG